MPEDPGDTGVTFIPGALVDPRAYERIFAPIVDAGYPVFIVKPPLGLAFTVPDAVADAETAAPEVEQWVIAGHSLGGALASDQLDNAAGLILLGSVLATVAVGLAGGPVAGSTGRSSGLAAPRRRATASWVWTPR